MAQQATMWGKNCKSFSPGSIKPLLEFQLKSVQRPIASLLSSCFVFLFLNAIKFRMCVHRHTCTCSVFLVLWKQRCEKSGDAELVLKAEWASFPCLPGLCSKTAFLCEENKIRPVKGCSHWGDKGDRRCKLLSRMESLGRLLHPWPTRTRGPHDVLGALLVSARLCWRVLRSSSIPLRWMDRNKWEMAFNSAFTWHKVVFVRRGTLRIYLSTACYRLLVQLPGLVGSLGVFCGFGVVVFFH